MNDRPIENIILDWIKCDTYTWACDQRTCFDAGRGMTVYSEVNRSDPYYLAGAEYRSREYC